MWDNYAVRADELNTSVETSINSTGVPDMIGNLTERVDALGQAITNMQIVLDSGALVGATSSKIDSKLGQISARRARAN